MGRRSRLIDLDRIRHCCGHFSLRLLGAWQGSLGFGTAFSKSLESLFSAIPESRSIVGVTQIVGDQLKKWLQVFVAPEFLRTFDSPIDLLLSRFDQRAGDR